MSVDLFTTSRLRAWTLGALLLSGVPGCASPFFTKKSAAVPPSAAVDPSMVGRREIQTIRQEPSEVDGQTSWIIEPDVPRIPKVAGLNSKLPPHIEKRMSRAFDLAQRGATYSANTEFREVLGLCALELDAQQSGTSHRDALRQGLVALDEADDLASQQIDFQDEADVEFATAGHSTPVLHGDTHPEVDAIQALQLYYSYAEQRFAYACEGMPAASLAYYGLARTYVLPGTRHTHAAGKSAMLQRVALRIAPQNMLAANELGVLMAQHGHLNEAESLFRQCVATDATPEAWQNLSAVYARKGDIPASRAAASAGSALVASKQVAQSQGVAAQESAVADSSEHKALASNHPIQNNAGDDKDGETKKGFWSKLELSQRLPAVFRR